MKRASIPTERELSKKQLRAFLEYLALKLIAEKRANHGYGILKAIQRKFGFLYSASEIYPTLWNLERAGFITSVWNMELERPRKEYATTGKARPFLETSENLIQSITRI